MLGKRFICVIQSNPSLFFLSDLDANDDDITVQDSFVDAINKGDYAPYPNKLVSQLIIPEISHLNNAIISCSLILLTIFPNFVYQAANLRLCCGYSNNVVYLMFRHMIHFASFRTPFLLHAGGSQFPRPHHSVINSV